MRIEKLDRPGDLKEWLSDSVREGQTYFAVDVETSGLTRQDRILSCAVSGPTENEIAFFGPELLSELMLAPEGSIYVMHNASFDLRMLAWHGVPLHEKYEYRDTLIYSHLLNENGEHSLGALVEAYYHDRYKAAFWEKFKKFEAAPEEEGRIYNASDVRYTRKLYNDLSRMLQDDGVPSTLINHVHSLQRSLLDTEIRGIAVDREYLLSKGVELRTKIERLVPKMRSCVADEISLIECEEWSREIDKRKTPAGRDRVQRPVFSFDSAKQLQALLYGHLRLPEQKNDKTKNVSVDFDSLEKIKDRHPVIEMIQQYREANKLYGTYVEGLLDKIVDGRIYPSLNVCGTTTGRISHSNPNLGNMPRDAGLRGMFIPDPGCVFVTADYAALEVYIEAHFTQDPNLLKIVNEGASKHDITMEGLKEFKIDRNTAKTINFASAYFCSHYKIAKILGCSEAKAKQVYDKYWAQYNGSLELKKQTDEMVDRGEPIINPFGRRRRFEVRKRKEWDGDYRAAYNARIQGTGSDCMSWALYTVDKRLREKGWGKALFSIHDEGVLMVKKEYAQESSKLLVDTMVEAGRVAGLTVELKAEPCIMEERWLD